MPKLIAQPRPPTSTNEAEKSVAYIERLGRRGLLKRVGEVPSDVKILKLLSQGPAFEGSFVESDYF